MKKGFVLFLAVVTLGVVGCKPDLVVKDAQIDFTAKVVTVEVKNIGDGAAGEHLTYIEINHVGATTGTPEAQHSARITGINNGTSWLSGPIPFASFSTRPGMDLNSLTSANLVVRADAKNMVEENDETNNTYDANH